jgi:hypothetical protein
MSVIFVELNKFIQWVLANHIRIEHEKETRLVILLNDLFCKTDWTRRTHGLTF